MKKNLLIVVLITLFAGFLRFYLLGAVPGALHRDEAFWGYNAFSLLKTAHDMTGDFLPLHLKSFLFSPALYAYFSIPFVWIFGLSDMSIRFASAFFGTLTVPALYYLMINLFHKEKNKHTYGLIASIILTLLPWHINLSRLATENTLVIFFIIVATTLFLQYANKNSIKYLFLSYFLFFLTIFLYQMPRSFLPLYIPFLYFCFDKVYLKSKKFLYHISIFVLIIVIPICIIMKSGELSLRIKTVSIFATPENILKIEEQRREEFLQGSNTIISKAFHNKGVFYTKTMLENYFSHFTYEFYFTDKALPDRYRIPLSPLVLLSTLPFLLYGFYSCFALKKIGLYIIGTVLLIPFGSALTFDDIPNLQRTMPMSVLIAILICLGITQFFSIKFIRNKKYFVIIFILLFLFEFISYLRQYYIHSFMYRPWYRNDGYEELVDELKKFPNEKIVITNRESAPAIFLLFYNSYDPAIYQEISKKSSSIHYDLLNFDRFEFSEEECPLKIENNDIGLLNKNEEKLYVNSSLCKLEKGTRLIKTIKRTDGSDVFYILKPNK